MSAQRLSPFDERVGMSSRRHSENKEYLDDSEKSMPEKISKPNDGSSAEMVEISGAKEGAWHAWPLLFRNR